MRRLFTDNIVYKRRARFGAILWTLLIFVLCLMPGKEVPKVEIPLIDKWAHFIFFGVFSFLWLLSLRTVSVVRMAVVLCLSILVGWLVEYLQGALTFLGRSQDNVDTLADGIGGLLGVIVFYALRRRSGKHKQVS